MEILPHRKIRRVVPKEIVRAIIQQILQINQVIRMRRFSPLGKTKERPEGNYEILTQKSLKMKSCE